MRSLVPDLRYAFRESLRRPGFYLFAALTLALGIGAVTMMYSVIYNVLLNPFPYTDPRRMVDVIIRNTNDGSIRGALTVPEFRAFVDQSGVFEDAVGTNSTQMLYRSESGVEQLVVAALTPNSFRFLGVSALLGRTINEEDAAAGAPPVAVISHKAWITYFSADPGILGRTVLLDSGPMTVIGVMPPRFTWNVADVWIPDPAASGDPDGMKKGFWLQARLKRGLSLSQAEAQLNIIGARLAQLYPGRYPKRFTISVITVIDWVVGRFRWVLYTLFGAVGLLLLIACCNVANMLLARATARERELAIRSALGATRFRILQQAFVESLLLALGGGLLGILFAYGGLRALKQFIPPYTIAVETEIGINPSVLWFSLLVAMFTALLFGVAPALHSTRRDIAMALSASGKGADLGTRHGGLRRMLVVCEVTLSLVLLSGAAVLMQSFLSLLNQNLGFNPQNVLATRMDLPNATPAEKRQFLNAALNRLAALPGVTAAGISSGMPPYGGGGIDMEVPGKPHAEPWTGTFELCNDTYFQTVGFRFVSGSAFAPGDVASGRKVAVVNETLRKRYFGGEDPLGKQIRLPRFASVPGGIPDPTFLIVGVVQDIRNRGLEEPVAPEVFVPFTSVGVGLPRILIRTSPDVHLLANAVRREIRAANGNVVQRDPMIIDDTLAERAYARPRFSVLLMAVFGGLGLLLVATGVYGVMAYVVSRQTREIGIRMALGAQRSQVFRSVFASAFRLIGFGALLGAASSVATNRIIANRIWAVRLFDPVALSVAVALIAVIGGVACFHPAFRATRVDPSLSLRQE